MPARKPPTTGYGTNRTNFPSRKLPSTKKSAAVASEVTPTAATSVGSASAEGAMCLPIDAAMSARMTEVFSCGAAMAGRYELPRPTTAAITSELTSTMPIPAGR